MKLAIFGATGKTGIPLVQQALDDGHEVVAFARTPSKMSITHDNLTIVQGDVMNAADVEKAVAGANIVLSAVGHTKKSPKNLQTVATENIIAAMKKYGIKRFISLSGAGIPAEQDQPWYFDHIIRFALKTLSGHVLADAENHVEVLKRHDDIEWVVVRGPMLTEKPATENYRVGWVGVNTGPRASRENVADFMLTLINDDTYLHQMPVISD